MEAGHWALPDEKEPHAKPPWLEEQVPCLAHGSPQQENGLDKMWQMVGILKQT